MRSDNINAHIISQITAIIQYFLQFFNFLHYRKLYVKIMK
nr:MAG TPA: hypothetical protein [Caudoviricetes sp.]